MLSPGSPLGDVLVPMVPGVDVFGVPGWLRTAAPAAGSVRVALGGGDVPVVPASDPGPAAGAGLPDVTGGDCANAVDAERSMAAARTAVSFMMNSRERCS